MYELDHATDYNAKGAHVVTALGVVYKKYIHSLAYMSAWTFCSLEASFSR
ncbi:hypothetical protein J2T20_000422 [Paenibacillus wynnii]|nr:hypothetical protein [Paenibacillus wynnii]